jgi:2-polyprenyl-3-methyl-5-hydroxy-6-metoxy-1,4-benzoquinol methylase
MGYTLYSWEDRMTSERKNYWIDYMEAQVGGDALSQVCRPNVDTHDFCVMVADLTRKLGSGKSLLDIGAGNGLIDILLSPHYAEIVAVEPAKSLYEILVKNTEHFDNVETINAFGEDIDLGDREFDRVLLYAVSGVLDSPDTLFVILDSVSKHFGESCRVLIGSINDSQFRDSYLKELPNILKGKGFSEERIEEIVEGNRMASWHDYESLRDYFNRLRFDTKRVPTYPLHLLYDKKFDLIAER